MTSRIKKTEKCNTRKNYKPYSNYKIRQDPATTIKEKQIIFKITITTGPYLTNVCDTYISTSKITLYRDIKLIIKILTKLSVFLNFGKVHIIHVSQIAKLLHLQILFLKQKTEILMTSSNLTNITITKGGVAVEHTMR